MNELALFSGSGGGILGGKLLGWRTVCAVEIDSYATGCLASRQNDGCLEPFPIWDDVTTFDGRPWNGIVDVVSGGFPCQDISAAGKGAGITGERSGLWREFARIIREVGPRFAFVENSPVLTSRGLGVVLGDLASMGYDARWCVLGALHAGAPHKRERIWILANARCRRCSAAEGRQIQQPGRTEVVGAGAVADSNVDGLREQPEPELGCHSEAFSRVHGEASEVADTARVQPRREEQWAERERARQGCECIHIHNTNCEHGRSGAGGEHWQKTDHCSWWKSEPSMGRVAHGVADRVDRLRCLGNGQVPAVAATAWRLLYNQIT